MSRFKLGETYLNGSGESVRIICVDSQIRSSGSVHCPIIGEITFKGQSRATGVVYFDYEGFYAGSRGSSYKNYNLVSDEPTEEELKLIASVRDIFENGGRSDDRELVKVIRQLRKK